MYSGAMIAPLFVVLMSHLHLVAAQPWLRSFSTVNSSLDVADLDVAWPYKFFFPLVVMRLTELQQTNAWVQMGAIDGGYNQLLAVRNTPDPDFTAVVKPNLDTLYSSAWLDLDAEPVVLTVPAIPKERFFMFQMMDIWTNIFGSPSTITTKGEAAAFAICGPNFEGTLPADVTRYNSSTREVWLLGRTQIFGSELEDLSPVWAIQDEYQLYLLSDYMKSSKVPRPHIEEDAEATMLYKPPELVKAMSAEAFYTNASEIMERGNPLSPNDPAAVKKLSGYGVVPGQALVWSDLRLLQRAQLSASQWFGQAAILWAAFRSAVSTNGWRGFPNSGDTIGNFGTNYDIRAAVAEIGLGANIPADAVYRIYDSPKFQIMRSEKYTMTFSDAENLGTPPVNAFWSVTVYNSAGYLIANDLNRYALGSESALNTAADGSITIYLQADEPTDAAKKQNWLPIPADGKFSLAARMYWPTDAILQDEWVMPSVEGA